MGFKKTNDYFLEFSPGDCKTVEHADIPQGYKVCHYKACYVPVGPADTLMYRGAGTNAHTMNVPIYYAANPAGLRRAINFLKEWAAIPHR